MPPIGKRVKEARAARALTQKQLAKQVGVTEAYVSMIERGAKEPGDATCIAIAHVTGFDPDWIRTGEGSPVARGGRTDAEDIEAAQADAGLSDDDIAHLGAVARGELPGDERAHQTLQKLIKAWLGCEAYRTEQERRERELRIERAVHGLPPQ